ncbi:uncharacterized protein LOC129005445 [Macrosteles quadrilineatus]|uniref:uncharacterized protein LOC129005445 n=1 Tax=Macrosteles quadrilineatus TaxID=74068 RepID=UPI0023E18C5D|nr:uncharacterized protein LOC129005445 [Macrosteles quadrilineatus]
MVTVQGLLTFSCLLLAEVMVCHGFWYFSSSPSNTAKKMGGPPPPMPGYSVRSETPYGPWSGPPAPYQADPSGHLTVALPVAVPYQPQMAPPPQTLQGRLHDVQLVPCLCPVSTLMGKDFDPSQPQTQGAPQASNYAQMQHQASSTANNP